MKPNCSHRGIFASTLTVFLSDQIICVLKLQRWFRLEPSSIFERYDIWCASDYFSRSGSKRKACFSVLVHYFFIEHRNSSVCNFTSIFLTFYVTSLLYQMVCACHFVLCVQQPDLILCLLRPEHISISTLNYCCGQYVRADSYCFLRQYTFPPIHQFTHNISNPFFFLHALRLFQKFQKCLSRCSLRFK